jgi:hypothetical protein
MGGVPYQGMSEAKVEKIKVSEVRFIYACMVCSSVYRKQRIK